MNSQSRTVQRGTGLVLPTQTAFTGRFKMTAQEPIQPKDKTDSKWLRDAGYPLGMPQFMAIRGLQFPFEVDKAKELINKFRNDEQKKWEACNRNTGTEPSKVFYSLTANYFELEKQKTDPKLIEAAMEWHLRYRHAHYYIVKQLPAILPDSGVPILRN